MFGIPTIKMLPKTSKEISPSESLKRPHWNCWRMPTNAASTSQENSETCTDVASVCKICRRSFTCEKMLKDHNTKHHYIRHCPNCPQTFRRTRTFMLHLRSHLNDYPYKCPFCLVAYNKKILLVEHVRESHNSIIKLQCQICLKVFFHENSFLVHQMSHVGPYPCSSCDAVFLNYYDRVAHTKNHVNRCPLCTKEDVFFATNRDLSDHICIDHAEDLDGDITEHTVEPCVSTGAVNLVENSDSDSMDDLFSSDDESLADIDYDYKKDAVNPLYTLKCKEKFICFICDNLFPSSELLKSHLKAHNWFQCNFCPKFFADPETFSNHVCDLSRVPPRTDVNCNSESENKNVRGNLDDVTSYTFEEALEL